VRFLTDRITGLFSRIIVFSINGVLTRRTRRDAGI
jgi:hypothetical protein